MSKLVYVCSRNSENSVHIINKVSYIANVILPDNIVADSSVTAGSNGIVIGVFNQNQSVKIRDTSICLGYIHEMDNWYVPSQERPDGSFVLFRGNQDCVQVLTDAVASRTIWYYIDDEIFIAATSQRAIVMLLGSFEFNRQVIPWMLSSGSLGPNYSWDYRIKRLDGDAILTLDRASWKLSLDCQIPQFSPRNITDSAHELRLHTALDEAFSNIKLNYSQWALLLSGGVDSRSILCLLKNKVGLRTVTWGVQSSITEKLNDAYIANLLAAHFGLEHIFFETDLANEQIEVVFHRYLICGEGTSDHISGYLDGFAVWKHLYESGVNGIIRGDEGFGWAPVASELDVRLSLGLSLWSDFSNLRSLKELGLPDQRMPAELVQQDVESLEMWRDRLYHQFRIPVVLGALNDLKLSYVEIANPLLSRKIIEVVRTLPDHLRTNKELFRSIAASITPDIPYAQQQAIADKDLVMQTKHAAEFLKNELTGNQADSILPREFLNYVFSQMTSEDHVKVLPSTSKIKRILKLFLPRVLISTLKGAIAKPKMDFNSLAFRSFLIIKMHNILSMDAENGRMV